jgi:hypothetical protein
MLLELAAHFGSTLIDCLLASGVPRFLAHPLSLSRVAAPNRRVARFLGRDAACAFDSPTVFNDLP